MNAYANSVGMGQSAPECNDKCARCGGEWVFKEPWWAYGGSKTSTDLSWGYLVHCGRQHFHWFRAELSREELAKGRARFERIGQEDET